MGVRSCFRRSSGVSPTATITASCLSFPLFWSVSRTTPPSTASGSSKPYSLALTGTFDGVAAAVADVAAPAVFLPAAPLFPPPLPPAAAPTTRTADNGRIVRRRRRTPGRVIRLGGHPRTPASRSGDDPEQLLEGRLPLGHLDQPVLPEGQHPLGQGGLLDVVRRVALHHLTAALLAHAQDLVGGEAA